VLLRSDRHYAFEAERPAVWAAMGSLDAYRRWWPWLAGFEARALEEGDVWVATVQPPLPYRLRFTVTLTEVQAAELVVATVDGDVRGRARLELADAPQGCDVHLVSDLGPGHRALQAVAVVARPVVVRSHDWVLDTGARQFAQRALPRPGGDGSGPAEGPA
jgi:hypothetical protein